MKYQELIDKNDSNISSGLLVIDHDTYEWTQNYDENDYVIEGYFRGYDQWQELYG